MLVGDISAALNTAREITRTPSKAKALAKIAAAQAKGGEQIGAESTLSSILPGFDKTLGYVRVAEALLEPVKVTSRNQ